MKSSRIMILDFSLGSTNFRIENIYILSDRLRRKSFLDDWTSSNNYLNYILVGNFNVNLYSANRLNSKPKKLDPPKQQLQTKLLDLVNTQAIVSIFSLQTFLQRVKEERLILNKIDYIFILQNLLETKA